jgi:hexosaminidase
VREIIAYARDRGIRVIPEFDIPGHSTAWFVGYPDLASAPGPYEIERKWGVFDPAMNPTEERTYKFLDEFIGEMTRLFPDQFFHIGGDEVNGKQWDSNPKIQEFMRAHDLKNNQALQAYFNTRVQKIVQKHGKTMIGWDEILSPDLPKDIVIQSWRGQASLADAAKQGYRGLLSSGYYLDLIWPASRHYAVDPMVIPSGDAVANLSADEQKRILGGEACMWSEYASPENLDSRIWPRAAVVAERLWSPQSVTDVASMYSRLADLSLQLEGLGLTHDASYDSMLRRISGTADIADLKALADVVEPVKDYNREATAPAEPTSAMPLNRLVDATRPESAQGREFNSAVSALLTDKSNTALRTEIRQRLTTWRDCQVRLQATNPQSFLLQEAMPVSRNLASLANAGLQALDYLESNQPAPDDWETQQRLLLEAAKKPQAQVEITIAAGVQKLVDAASQTVSSSRN